ncbi:hypothetical protein KIW84_051859 [Lathyrus oleraceus]|uniref:Retroviral polymerase SH3-like domain-containing protein n=1 Tax=Pisum sativum TaxID=3888 RepID=A0A9D4WL44_PEA|nr:hypothetical protein KIW84_051859 [Pisum sativum]
MLEEGSLTISEPMILVGFHKTSAYRLFNPINQKIMMNQDIVIDENSSPDWNSSDAIKKSFMSYDFDEASNDVEVEDILIEIEAAVDMPDIVEVEDGVASQRPQRTRARPTILKDYEVTGDEVTSDGELVHFFLLAGAEPINHSEALNDKKCKSAMVKEL